MFLKIFYAKKVQRRCGDLPPPPFLTTSWKVADNLLQQCPLSDATSALHPHENNKRRELNQVAREGQQMSRRRGEENVLEKLVEAVEGVEAGSKQEKEQEQKQKQKQEQEMVRVKHKMRERSMNLTEREMERRRGRTVSECCQ
jgi:hypothetical protein